MTPLNGMIDWQAYYHANRHKPLNKILAEYNFILQEFTQKLQMEAVAQTAQPSMMSTPAAVAAASVGGGGPSGTVIVINLSGSTTAYMSSSYTASVSANGLYPPFTFSILRGILPPGLTLNPTTGLISGIPVDEDSFTFTILAKGRYGDYSGKDFTINVTTAGITISGTFANGVTSGSYTGSVGATGGESPYTYTLISGSLPSGATLNSSSGLISSSFLTGEGQYVFVIKATDFEGYFSTSSFSMSVIPNITVTGSLPAAYSGSSYTASIYALGGVGPYTYTQTSGSLPSGSTLNTNTGKILGVLDTTGSYGFTILATDTGSYTGSGNFSIEVLPAV